MYPCKPKPGVAPPVPALTPDEIRATLQYYEESADLDGKFAFWIDTGSERIEKITGRPLSETVFVMRLDAWPKEIILPRAPVTELVSVKYKESDEGEWTELDEGTEYDADIFSEPARIRPAYGTSWPALYKAYLPIEIEFKAGGDPPPGLLRALELFVLTCFWNREGIADMKDRELLPAPFGFESMLLDHQLAVFR